MATNKADRKKVVVPGTTVVGGQVFFGGEAHVKPEHAAAIAAAAKRPTTRVRRQVDDEPNLSKNVGDEGGDEIPANFPHASILTNEVNQVASMSELKKMSDEDLQELDDIGPGRAAEIREALDALQAE
jgi:ERCC4-type nuclease